MSLERLGIEDFRCIERAELEFDPRCNLISGQNASGKTSLLEAIFFLGRGRSFRTNRSDTLVRAECPAVHADWAHRHFRRVAADRHARE